MIQRERSVLAVDVDEVLVPFVDGFAAHHNALYGTDFDREAFFTYEFDRVLKVSIPETIRRVFEYMDAMDVRSEPIDDARQALEKMKERDELVVVTARDPRFATMTEQYLALHFPDIFAGVEMVGHPEAYEQSRTKLDVCRTLGARGLIDDALHHLVPIRDDGRHAVLFGDYPWNRTLEVPDRIVSCPTWPKVEEYFEQAA